MANLAVSGAQAQVVQPQLSAGDCIEGYVLLHPIAQGGMGSVWAARVRGANGVNDVVAIKTALPGLAAEARVRAMFVNEARLASAVVHPNVARILDFFESDGALYLVMERIDGPSLKTLQGILAARGERIPDGVLLRVAADVCAGLHAAHEVRDAFGASCNLVHRDVSPHNIMIGLGGDAKLIDFGVAKARDCAAQETSFGALKGKPHFMAPEQARADRIDRRADVWGVGAVMFYILAGSAPFETSERADTLRRLLAGTPARSLPEHVHPAIARIVEGCLAHCPEDRFQTAEEVRLALEMAMDDLGLEASALDVAAFVQEHARDLFAEEEQDGLKSGRRDGRQAGRRDRGLDPALSYVRGSHPQPPPSSGRRTLALFAARVCVVAFVVFAIGQTVEMPTRVTAARPRPPAPSVVHVEEPAAERAGLESASAVVRTAPATAPPSHARRAQVRASRPSAEARPTAPSSPPPTLSAPLSTSSPRAATDTFGSAVETRK